MISQHKKVETIKKIVHLIIKKIVSLWGLSLELKIKANDNDFRTKNFKS